MRGMHMWRCQSHSVGDRWSTSLKGVEIFSCGLCFSASLLLSFTTPVSGISMKKMYCSLTFKWGICMRLFLSLNNMNIVLLPSLKYNFGVGGRHSISYQYIKIISLVIFKHISFLFIAILKGWGLSSFFFSFLVFPFELYAICVCMIVAK